MGFEVFSVSTELKTLHADLALGSGARVTDALNLFAAMCKVCGPWADPFVLDNLQLVLDKVSILGTKQPALAAVEALLRRAGASTVKIVAGMLLQHLKSDNWARRRGAHSALQMLEELHTEYLQENMFEVITAVLSTASVQRSEEEIELIRVTLTAMGRVMGNESIKRLVPGIITTYLNLANIDLGALVNLCTTMVAQEVDAACLGFIAPLITSTLKGGSADAQMDAARIMHKLSLFVHDPVAAARFHQILEPALESAAAEMGSEFGRSRCRDALACPQAVSAGAQVLPRSPTLCSQQDLAGSLNKALTKALKALPQANSKAPKARAQASSEKGTDAAEYAVLVTFMARCASFLVMGDSFANVEWINFMVPYLKIIVRSEEQAAAVAEEAIAECTAPCSGEKADPAEVTQVIFILRANYWAVLLLLTVLLVRCLCASWLYCRLRGDPGASLPARPHPQELPVPPPRTRPRPRPGPRPPARSTSSPLDPALRPICLVPPPRPPPLPPRPMSRGRERNRTSTRGLPWWSPPIEE